MALVELRDVHKTFTRGAERIEVFTGLTLDVEQGSFTALMGPSGSGKSTLLNLVAGLDRPTSGTVRVNGAEVSSMSPAQLASWRAENVGFVFQQFNLLPVLTAYQNVELPLLLTRLGRKERDERIRIALGVVGLEDRMSHYPRQLSGGQEQRVAIARAIVADPTLVLLDEPFGALDALTRATLQDELMRIVQRTGSTVLMVTHDVDEAVLLSDRVVMMTNGPAARIGEVLEVNLPRPRERLALAADPRFVALRARVLKFLYEDAAPRTRFNTFLRVAV